MRSLTACCASVQAATSKRCFASALVSRKQAVVAPEALDHDVGDAPADLARRASTCRRSPSEERSQPARTATPLSNSFQRHNRPSETSEEHRMSAESLIKEPEGGARIVSGQPTPDNPIIPFIEGDGIGVDITPGDAGRRRRRGREGVRRRAPDPLDGGLRRREVDPALRRRRVAAGRDARGACATTSSRSRAR